MPDKQLFTFREPVGTAMIITAGNFPVAVPSWYLVPALLCGNTVVWKPALYAAACAEALAELFVRGGLPRGVLTVVHADGAETFAGLEKALDAGLVQKVGFTGSTEVGRKVGELCGRHLQNPCLELGGKNPMVVTPNADLDLAVEGALFAGFGTAGQRCTSLGTAIVHESVHAEFLRRLRSRRRRGARSATRRRTSSMVRSRTSNSVLRTTPAWAGSKAITRWRVRSAGSAPATRGRGSSAIAERGLFYHPVIVDGVRPGDALFDNETFGPIVGVTSYVHAGGGDRSGQRARLRPVQRHLHAAIRSRCSRSGAASAPAWSASTTRPRAPRRICPSAATAAPATAAGSRACGCSTSSPGGRR